MESENKRITVKECKEILGCSTADVYLGVQTGVIPGAAIYNEKKHCWHGYLLYMDPILRFKNADGTQAMQHVPSLYREVRELRQEVASLQMEVEGLLGAIQMLVAGR